LIGLLVLLAVLALVAALAVVAVPALLDAMGSWYGFQRTHTSFVSSEHIATEGRDRFQ
jgi:Tfp pilus assembly protein FimT